MSLSSPPFSFSGSLVALVTPFQQDGSVDFGALTALIDFQIAHGTQGIFFFGVAGEGSVLTVAEQQKMIAHTARYTRQKTLFLYGCTGINTQDSVERVLFAQDHGADGVILTLPPAIGPSQEEAKRFFLSIAEATHIPIGIFNNPARLMTDLSVNILLELFQHPRIVLHKEGTSHTGQMASLLRASPPAFLLADECPTDILVSSMALGTRGIAHSIGNLLPKHMLTIAQPWEKTQICEQKWENDQPSTSFKEDYFTLLPLLNFLQEFRSPKALKALMTAVGLPAGEPRAPLTALQPDDLSRGLKVLQQTGWMETYGFNLKGRAMPC